MHSHLSKIVFVCYLCFLPLLVSTATNVTYRNTANKRKNLFQLSFIHINDFHARFEETNKYSNECKSNEMCIGGYARIVTVVKELQRTRTNPIYLNAGDTFAGTIWYTFGRWNVTSYFMNLHKADVMTIGNHEFDDGLEGVLPYLETIQSPMVLANVDISEEPEFQGKFNSSIVLTRGDHEIGVIGVLNALTNETANMGKISLLDEVDTVRIEAEKLKARGVNIIVVLSHAGLDVDYEIARKAGEHIDVIVGGHTHTFMYTGKNSPGPDQPTDEYPAVVTQANGRKVLIVQASAYAKYVGDLTVYFDEFGDVCDWSGNPVFLGPDVVPDERILEQMQPWMQQYNSSSQLAYSNIILENSDCYIDECILGDLLADTYLKYFRHQSEVMKSSLVAKPAIAIVQAGSIRATLEEGPISYADLITVMPFGNTIDTLDIKGKHLWDAFEHSVKRIDLNQSASGQLFQVSGMRFAINVTHPPGHRVISIEILCTGCETELFESIDLERIYRIALSHYMADGHDGFTMITNNKENHVIGAVDIDIVSQHLKLIGEINEFKKSNRITILQ